MTNKEAIKWLKQSMSDCTSGEDEPFREAYGISILAIQENTKLKAEIENSNRIISNMIDEHECGVVGRNVEIINLKAEIEQLKLELEQAIKLPCKVGDTVYIIGKCKDFPPKLDGTMYDSDGGFGTATGYYCPYENSDLCPFKDLEDCSFAENEIGIFEDVVCHICIEEDKMWYVCENSNGYEINDFGKTIFLSREEAEQALKDTVKKC